jgi:hypothetical protein
VDEERKKFEKVTSVLRKAYKAKEENIKEVETYKPWLAYTSIRENISIHLAHVMMSIPNGCVLKHVQTTVKQILPNVDFVRITAPIRKAKKKERMLAEKKRLEERDRDRAFRQELREDDERCLMFKEDFDVLVEDDDPEVQAMKRMKARDIEGEKLVKYILPLWKKKKLVKRLKFMPHWYRFHKEVDRRVLERATLNAEKRKSKKINRSRAKDELGLNYSYSNFTEDWALRFIEKSTFEEKLSLIKEYGKFCYSNNIDRKIGESWSQSYMVFRE